MFRLNSCYLMSLVEFFQYVHEKWKTSLFAMTDFSVAILSELWFDRGLKFEDSTQLWSLPTERVGEITTSESAKCCMVEKCHVTSATTAAHSSNTSSSEESTCYWIEGYIHHSAALNLNSKELLTVKSVIPTRYKQPHVSNIIYQRRFQMEAKGTCSKIPFVFKLQNWSTFLGIDINIKPF